MAYLRDHALVLKREPFREQDAWVTLYGREFGKLVAVARGARVPRAKQLGHLEPLATIEVMIAKGQAFDKLAVARTVRSNHRLHDSLTGLTVCSAFADLIAQATQPHVPDERIFLLAEELVLQLEGVADAISPERASILYASAVLRLLRFLGYSSRLDVCVLCQAPLGDRSWAIGAAGGLVCPKCLIRESSWRERAVLLDPSMRKLLLFLQRVSSAEVLKVSAPPVYFRTVTQAVQELTHVLPLRSAPHGFQTIPLILS